MGNTFQILLRLGVCKAWQRLGVPAAQASVARRSGGNPKTLRAVAVDSTFCPPARASASAAATHISDRTHPAQVGRPQLANPQFSKIDQRLAAKTRLQPDRIADKGFTHKPLAATPFDLTIAAHPPHGPRPGITHLGSPGLTWSAAIELGWRPLRQRFMGPDLIINFDPAVRTPLLRPAMTRRRFGCLRLEHPVHLFVSAILFGMPRINKLHTDPQRRPPGAQTRKPHRPARSKGMAIVHPNDLRVTVPAKEPPKLPLHRWPALVRKQANGQHFAAEQIPDRQRLHTPAILRPKPALEVDCPYVIAPAGHGQGRPRDGRAAPGAPPAATAMESQSFEPFANRACRGTLFAGMFPAQPGRQLPATPTPVAATQLSNPPPPQLRCFSWGTLGPPRTIPQSAQTIAFKTPLPLVASPAAPAEFPAQNGHALLGLHGQFHKPQPPHGHRHLFPSHAQKKGPK